MNLFDNLLDSIEESKEEILIKIFDNSTEDIYLDLNQCLINLEDSDIYYGYFDNSNIIIKMFMVNAQGQGSVSGNGDYYLSDDDNNFTFYLTPQDLINSLDDYELNDKEKQIILKDLKSLR